MGEDPATVHVIGTPSLDAVLRDDLPDRAALEADLGIPLAPPVVVVTVHPATLEADAATTQSVLRLALGQTGISSQMIDNINASIHVRALLTDVFIVDEILKGSKS